MYKYLALAVGAGGDGRDVGDRWGGPRANVGRRSHVGATRPAVGHSAAGEVGAEHALLARSADVVVQLHADVGGAVDVLADLKK